MESRCRAIQVISCAAWVLSAIASVCLADAARPVPWVAGVTDNSVYVCLEATNNTENALVDFGLTGGYGFQSVTESAQFTTSGCYVHNVKLTGLLPNTQYHYRVTQGSSVGVDYTFWTAPQPGTPVRWGFAADTHTHPDVHNTMAGLIGAQNPRMMVYGGDLVSHYDTYNWWSTDWFVSNQIALNATVPWVAAAGNHDGWPAWTKSFTQGPNDDGITGEGYFSFDYGDAHILILNNCVPYGPGSAQWNFAASDLAATTRKWKIVAFHEPAYVWWEYGEGGNATMQAMTSQIFEPEAVDLVLNGHYHFYQDNLVNGIHHMVISSCGGDIEPGVDGPYTLYTAQTHSFGIIDMTPKTLTIKVYGDDGSLIDTVIIPEPATVCALVIGGLTVLARRPGRGGGRHGPSPTG